jgi:hypothetical protein
VLLFFVSGAIPDNQAIIAQAGGIEIVMKSLTSFPADPAVQAQGFRALEQLGFQSVLESAENTLVVSALSSPALRVSLAAAEVLLARSVC